MLENLMPVIAADEGSSDEILTFVYNEAVKKKNDAVLSILAGRRNLPDNVAEGLSKVTSAKVLIAWLTRPQAGPDELMAAAKDKRITVGEAVASATNLEREVYAQVLNAHRAHGRVTLELAKNASVPGDIACEALALTISRGGNLSWRRRYELRELTTRFIGQHTDQADRLVGLTSMTEVPEEALSCLVDAPGLSQESVDKLTDFLIERGEDEAANASGSRWRPRATYGALLVKLAAYMDVPEKKVAKIRKILAWAPNLQKDLDGSARTIVRPSAEVGEPESEDLVRSILRGTFTLTERYRAVGEYDLTDEQFSQVLRENENGWYFRYSANASDKFHRLVEQTVAANAGNPARLAAIALTVPAELLNKDVYLPQLDQVIKHLLETYADYNVDYSLRDDWLNLVSAHGIDREIASVLPMRHAVVRSLAMHSEDPALRASYYREVARYLWENLGEDEASWAIFDQVGSSLEGTLQDAIHTTREIQGK